MRVLTIRSKIITVLLVVFFISVFIVIMLLNTHLKSFIDRSETEKYSEKVKNVSGIIERRYKRLQATMMSEFYEEDFRKRLLEELKTIYYTSNDIKEYPTILNYSDITVVLHPKLKYGDKSVRKMDWVHEVATKQNGEIYYHFAKTDKWMLYRKVEGWPWIVAYVVPVNIKYKELRALRDHLILMNLSVGFIIFVILLVFLNGITRPLSILTRLTSEVADGKLDQSILINSNDEVGILAMRFAEMRDAIKDKIENLNKEIDSRRKAERELEKTKSYLSNVINSMPSCLIGIDKDGNVVNMNVQAQKFCGVDLNGAVGKSITEICPHFNEYLGEMKETIKNKVPIEKEKIAHEVDGEVRIANLTTYPLITNGVEGAVIRIDDVTEKTRLEKMMVQTEKMMSVGGLAAGMAHEINNPLASIIQGAQNISRRISPEFEKNKEAAKALGVDIENVYKYMDKREINLFIKGITDAGIRAAEIVKNMLNFSRQSEGAVRPENVSAILDEVLELASHDYDLKKKYDFKKIEIIKSYESKELIFICVKSEIEQVILNLLKNGAEIMFDKAQLEESQGREYVPAFYIRAYAKNNRVYLEVEDNGPGMDEGTKRRIFEPFYTTKPVGKGTGLGLSVSYFIITQNHKGNMWVESEEGKGAKFVIELPVE